MPGEVVENTSQARVLLLTSAVQVLTLVDRACLVFSGDLAGAAMAAAAI